MAEHQLVLDAITRGDREAARARMTDVVQFALADMRQSLAAGAALGGSQGGPGKTEGAALDASHEARFRLPGLRTPDRDPSRSAALDDTSSAD